MQTLHYMYCLLMSNASACAGVPLMDTAHCLPTLTGSSHKGYLLCTTACEPDAAQTDPICPAPSTCLNSVGCCRLNTAGLNGTSQRSRLLYDRWVLDVPKLLDLTAIYGPDNAALVQQLMQQAIFL